MTDDLRERVGGIVSTGHVYVPKIVLERKVIDGLVALIRAERAAVWEEVIGRIVLEAQASDSGLIAATLILPWLRARAEEERRG